MPDHRVERLQERYGLAWTVEQVDALFPRCTPYNRVRSGLHGDTHVVVLDGRAIVCVVKVLYNTGKRGIVTFLPPDCFNASNREALRVSTRGKGGKLTGFRREIELRNRRARRSKA